MSNSSLNTPEYLRSPCPNVWDWSERGDVATWSDRSTAAFASQLGLVLERLTVSLPGLPPLSSLLLVLQAASSSETTSPQAVTVGRLLAIAELAEQESLGNIASMLQALQALPADVRSGIDAQVALVEYLLADCPASLYEASDVSGQSVLQWLRLDPHDRPLQDQSSFVDETAYLKTRNRRTLASLFFMAARPLDVPAIELLRRTGLETLPEPTEVEPPTLERTGDLLRELRDDQQFGSLAQSALAVAATVSLPRRPQDHDVLPAGGVSDISNRGTPEQLLLSELAQEPMAMLARIATGQALYLRRESPPAPRPHCQPVLLEAGIRTWGKRRLQLATLALGISTALQRRNDVAVRVVTVAGQQHWEENFLSRDGLVEHLERLLTDIHPGPAIAQWLATTNSDKAQEAAAEPIIVVTANTDADPGFQAALRDVPRPYLIIRLEHDDVARILRRTAMGDEQLQHIALADASLGSPDAKRSDARPLFLNLQTSPLRFTYEFQQDWCCVGPNASLWLVTRDARLLWYPEEKYGGIEIVRGIQKRHIRAHQIDGDRLQLVVISEADSGVLLSINGPRQHAAACVLELCGIDGSAASFSLTDDALWVFHAAYLSMLDPATGQLLSRERIVGTKVGANVVLDLENHLTVKSRAAGKIVSNKIANPFGAELGHLIPLPDGESVAVTRDLSQGCLLPPFSASPPSTSFPTSVRTSGGPATYLATSSDQQRLLFELPPSTHVVRALNGVRGTPRYIMLTLAPEPGRVLPWENSVSTYAQLESAALPLRFPAVRKKLVGLQPHPNGLLLFRTHTQASVQLRVSANQRHLKLIQGRDVRNADFVEFDEPQPLDEGGDAKAPRLRRAVLRGGTVWLDSRGLLHLRCHRDGSELTLVLHDDHLAGWSNRWGVFGGPYFIAEDTAKPVPAEVVQWLQSFNLDCL